MGFGGFLAVHSTDILLVESGHALLVKAECIHEVQGAEAHLELDHPVFVIFAGRCRDLAFENVEAGSLLNAVDNIDILHNAKGFVEASDLPEKRVLHKERLVSAPAERQRKLGEPAVEAHDRVVVVKVHPEASCLVALLHGGADILKKGFRRQGIGMEKVENLSLGHSGSGVQLHGATFFAPAHPYRKLFQDVDPAAGFGLRIMFSRKTLSNLCIDFGFGADGTKGIFFNLNETF